MMKKKEDRTTYIFDLLNNIKWCILNGVENSSRIFNI